MTLLRIGQQICILPLYFKYPLFKTDLSFLKCYAFSNPYKICRAYFLQYENKNVFYGDTWPFSVPHFVRLLNLGKEDVFYDIGSGTSRISFWFQIISGCRVKAIEKVPFFIQKAQQIQQKLNNNKIEILQADLLDIDYSDATHIYFYASSFDDQIILSLIAKWKNLKVGTQIITTSFSLKEYGAFEYEIVNQYKVSYPWGTCTLFLNKKVEPSFKMK